MAISKVTLNGETLIDVTQDTVAQDNLLTGKTATGADGEKVAGALTIPTFNTQEKIVKSGTETIVVTPDGLPENYSGSIVTFNDSIGDRELYSLNVNIEPMQSGSGNPSPSNIRPISGWTGATITRAGKNLFDYSQISQIHSTAENIRWGIYFTLPGTYAVSASDSGIVARKKSSDGTYGSAMYLTASSNAVLTISKNEAIIVFYPGTGLTKEQAAAVFQRCNIQLESASSKTPYEPYAGTEKQISFPSIAGTVYGGTLDVPNGTLTVTHGQISSYNGETLPGAWISDRDVYTAGTTPTTGAQVVYELAEPVVYQLLPTEITTLLGENNIWADCGDIEVSVPSSSEFYDGMSKVTVNPADTEETYRTLNTDIIYTKNHEITLSTANGVATWMFNAMLPYCYFKGAEYMETFALHVQSGVTIPFDNSRHSMFRDCIRLRTIVLDLSISSFNGTNIFYNCTALESVQIGSLGKPFTAPAVTAKHFATCTALETITIYVDAEALADIPENITNNVPFGAPNAAVVYISSNTGEVITE